MPHAPGVQGVWPHMQASCRLSSSSSFNNTKSTNCPIDRGSCLRHMAHPGCRGCLQQQQRQRWPGPWLWLTQSSAQDDVHGHVCCKTCHTHCTGSGLHCHCADVLVLMLQLAHICSTQQPEHNNKIRNNMFSRQPGDPRNISSAPFQWLLPV